MKIEVLLDKLPDYYSPTDREIILRAYQTAEKAHLEKKCLSGEPYINHCAAVAAILAEFRLPANVVAAGLLHDTLDDTDLTQEDITQILGEDVANLVRAVSRLDQISQFSGIEQEKMPEAPQDQVHWEEPRRLGMFTPKTPQEKSRKFNLAGEMLQKIFLEMGQDIRAVLVVLADRLHHMRTLGHEPEKKRLQISRQTIDVFAPLADRLGIWQVKWELEDLAFRYISPDTYREIAENFGKRHSERQAEIKSFIDTIQTLLQQTNIQAKVTGRPKNIYAIYKKMMDHGLAFDDVHDIRAVRIVTADIPTCYTILGLIHNKWRPLPGKFNDYIAIPKENSYQSIHTVVITGSGKTLEVQIRTQEMHDNAEYGIASRR